MFAHQPLSFEYYGYDIENGKAQDIPDLTQDVEKAVLAEELKMSCTNVMLQCLDAKSRCIFILGTSSIMRIKKNLCMPTQNLRNC